MIPSGSASRPTRTSFGLLVLTFAMLWVPVGQHDFLFRHWMKLGTFMAPFLLFVAWAFRSTASKDAAATIRGISLTMLIAYLAHQFEEHWIDLFGNKYAFHRSINQLLQRVTGTEASPLTPAGIFVINTSLVWLVACLPIACGARRIFPVLAMASIIVVNAFAHIALGVVELAYNPGLLTSCALFVPLGGYVYRVARRDELASRRDIGWSMAWGIVAHAFMAGGLVASNVWGLFPEVVYFAILVLWSLVPLLVPTKADGSPSLGRTEPGRASCVSPGDGPRQGPAAKENEAVPSG